MKYPNRYLTALVLIMSASILFFSCQLDPDTDTPPKDPPNNGKQLEPDKISEYLVLKDANKIDGTLPTAPDGGILMDVQDTIYTVKGYSLGYRIDFQKATSQLITGYYIYVSGSSFYYDVPEDYVDGQFVPNEEEDTSSVLVLDLDLEDEEVDYPFTTEIVIQPHDDAGNPLDEFDRRITIEDPDDPDGGGCNTIAFPISNNHIHWEWDFTIREYNGEILNVFAPGLATPINSQGAGCCDQQGRSQTTSSSPSCGPGTTSMTWVQLEVNDYSVRTYELWQIYENGTMLAFGNHVKKQYNRATTNFCDGTVGYTFDNEDLDGHGTHDFTPGSDRINLSWTNWNGGYRPLSGSLIYTCHTMIRSWGGDDKFSAVYRRVVYNPYPDHNPVEFYYNWKPWFD